MKTKKWNIEPENSNASFSVKKLIMLRVTGNFENFEGQAETETEDFEFIKRICLKAAVNSIKTDDAKRDEHLKSADFFDMAKYPHILFVAEYFNINEKNIQANVTIKNITKPIVLHVAFDKTTAGEDGCETVELSVSGKINRRDFGLTWDGKSEAGEIIVGDEIELKAGLKFVKQAQNAPFEELKECVL